jgi:hypothetical protein
MYKNEVVELMTNYVHEMNRQRAYEAKMPSEQLEELIKQATPELMHVNGLLYDLLVENGVINNG